MEQTIDYRGQGLKVRPNLPIGPQPPSFESLRQRVNFTRVAAANRQSRFARPADLDEFVRGFYAL
ncbi:MAG: hypothetical protein JRG97_14310 [Deltaproteobacteria bacterium]|nr:hypothetical protein [Deltaproteobacteria bacterium]MBW2050810.1 hypothetical protein [Deltaproteobacteria bacterium]MBW2142215.1 hypothetical protein [Deltaproteobacteria bacterium]MBW2322677.1 hypothetical protein [Deltaproteobacteria bacterium]